MNNSNKNAIIGSTGFIGKNIIEVYDNFTTYNSKNIENLLKQEHDVVVCAAPSGSKWISNKEPLKDRENIDNLFVLTTHFNLTILLFFY